MAEGKFQYVNKINDYINTHFRRIFRDCNNEEGFYFDTNSIVILLGQFGIDVSPSDNNSFNAEYWKEAEEENLRKLHQYLFENQDLKSYFTDGEYAIEALKEDEFFNLNLYLQECFECNKAERKLATAVFLRCCLEIIINIYIKGSEKNLKQKIEEFFTDFDTKEEFKDFADKAQQLKPFFHKIRGIGNNVAHIKKDDMNDVINKRNLTHILKLICMVMENSILKLSIEAKKAEAKKKKIESIDFNIEEDVPF